MKEIYRILFNEIGKTHRFSKCCVIFVNMLHITANLLSIHFCMLIPFRLLYPNSSLSLHKCKPKHAVAVVVVKSIVVVYAKSPVIL
ncbi:hypothetical protein VNO77_29352 [Canavalia gladiata]|uniref:Uncharacterized protein n=1 Tax=Canavalia gladiata TaxID=3824 RepID=A0AAN9KWI9_CANGL